MRAIKFHQALLFAQGHEPRGLVCCVMFWPVYGFARWARVGLLCHPTALLFLRWAQGEDSMNALRDDSFLREKETTILPQARSQLSGGACGVTMCKILSNITTALLTKCSSMFFSYLSFIGIPRCTSCLHLKLAYVRCVEWAISCFAYREMMLPLFELMKWPNCC